MAPINAASGLLFKRLLLGFWTMFFIAYSGESVFRELLTLTIATGLALVLVPDDAGTDRDAAS